MTFEEWKEKAENIAVTYGGKFEIEGVNETPMQSLIPWNIQLQIAKSFQGEIYRNLIFQPFCVRFGKPHEI